MTMTVEKSMAHLSACRVPIRAKRQPVGCDVPPHTHDFCEVAVVIRGAARYVTRHGETWLEPGSVVACAPGDWHAYADIDDLYVINVMIGPGVVDRELRWVHDHADLDALLNEGGVWPYVLTPAALDRMIDWLSQVAAYRLSEFAGQSMQLIGLVSCALAELLTDQHQAEPQLSGPVLHAVTVMAENLAHPWRVPDLAALLSLSPSRVHALFAEQVGMSPMAWLAAARADRMSALLESTSLPVARAGASVGWDDPNYATRRFTQLRGESPSSYRNRLSA